MLRAGDLVQLTVIFVDLAGFTALTEVHGDDAAGDVVEAFVNDAQRATNGTSTRVVKSIGDAVMLVADGPDAALAAVGELLQSLDNNVLFLEPRAGLHHGPVVQRGDDYFGATVNLAARITAHAASGQTLATAEVSEAARRAGLDVVSLGSSSFRNVQEPVELFAIAIGSARVDMRIDPICRMRLSHQTAVGHVRHAGRDLWFCSLDCLRVFAADPARFSGDQA